MQKSKGAATKMITNPVKKTVSIAVVAFSALVILVFSKANPLPIFGLMLLATIALVTFVFLLPNESWKQALVSSKNLFLRLLCLIVGIGAIAGALVVYQAKTGGASDTAILENTPAATSEASAIEETIAPPTSAPTPAPTVEIVFSAAVMEAYNEGQDLYDEGHFDEAYPLFLKAAKAGHSNAQLYAGKCLQEDIDVDDDAMPAAYWYGLSAKQGNDAAQYELGRCYYSGDGVERNFDTAFEWFSEAASHDNANGLLWVGYCYHHGISVAQNYDLAMQYYLAAKENGHTYAQHRIDELLVDMNQ